MNLGVPKDDEHSNVAEAFRRMHPKEFYRKYLERSTRPDGRRLLEMRELRVEAGTCRP